MPPKELREMDETTPEQEQLIMDLLKIVVEPMKPDEIPPHIAMLDETDRRIAAYKFLVARKWDIKKAEEMWRATIAHKALYKTDAVGHFPPAFPLGGYVSDEINSFFGLKPREPDENDRIYKTTSCTYKATYHKHDKLGHPVFIERTGKINVKKIVRLYKGLSPVGVSYTQACTDYHVHFNEVGGRLVRFQDKTWGVKNGKRVLGVLAILDVQGLGYGHMYKPALELLKKVFECDAAFYPEGLHALYVVNCPTMITFAYSIVKLWLDPRVQGKITFLKPSQTKEGLLQVIAAENLPDFLGGDDTSCPISRLDENDDEGGADETLTEEIKVAAGKCIVKHLPVAEGEEVTWEFTLDTMTIEFMVTFVEGEDALSPPPTPGAPTPASQSPASTASYIAASAKHKSAFEGLATEVIVPRAKVGGGTDTFKASKKGTVVLTWDNGFSWLNSKVVTLRAMRM